MMRYTNTIPAFWLSPHVGGLLARPLTVHVCDRFPPVPRASQRFTGRLVDLDVFGFGAPASLNGGEGALALPSARYPHPGAGPDR